jgi:S-DNA-T family DNA segregation ATPase FtsK/SpoIIIE
MSRSRTMGGVYQPRARRAAFADAMAEARHAVARAMRMAIMRGAGALLFLTSAAALVALATYNSADPSFDSATGASASNLLGRFGAIAADLMLQGFGIAALAFLAPPAVWGARTFVGRFMHHPQWRAAAWPLGTLFMAAGLGGLPALTALPAGDGGLIGISAAGLATHAGIVWHQPWVCAARVFVFRGHAAGVSGDGSALRTYLARRDECARLLCVDSQSFPWT